MKIILSHKIENAILIDKYLMGTELEVDAICDGETVLIPGIMEHIERAGVHSGDSIAVYPAFMLTESQKVPSGGLFHPSGAVHEYERSDQYPVCPA